MVDPIKGTTSRGGAFYRCGKCKAKYFEEEPAQKCCQEKSHQEIFEDVIGNVLTLTIHDALDDGGLWSDGTFLWFRQTRLCRLKMSNDSKERWINKFSLNHYDKTGELFKTLKVNTYKTEAEAKAAIKKETDELRELIEEHIKLLEKE